MRLRPQKERRLTSAVRRIRSYQAKQHEKAQVARITREAEQIRRLEARRMQLEADLKRETRLHKLKSGVKELEGKERQLKQKRSLMRQLQRSPALKSISKSLGKELKKFT